MCRVLDARYLLQLRRKILKDRGSLPYQDFTVPQERRCESRLCHIAIWQLTQHGRQTLPRVCCATRHVDAGFVGRRFIQEGWQVAVN